DSHLHDVADRDLSLRHRAQMDVEVTELLLSVVDGDLDTAGAEHDAAVAHLAAGFAVERSLVGDEGDPGAGLGRLNRFVVDQEGDDLALGDFSRVAQELGGAELFAQLEPLALGRGFAGAGPGLAGGGALALHGGVEAGIVDLLALAAQDVLGKVEREAEGVVELEGDLAGQRLVVAESGRLLVEQAEAAGQHLLEASLLELEGL